MYPHILRHILWLEKAQSLSYCLVNRSKIQQIQPMDRLCGHSLRSLCCWVHSYSNWRNWANFHSKALSKILYPLQVRLPTSKFLLSPDPILQSSQLLWPVCPKYRPHLRIKLLLSTLVFRNNFCFLRQF